MCAAIRAGLDRFLSNAEQNPIVNYPDFDFALWMNSVQSILNVGQLSAAVFWPPQVDRGRVYVHLLDANDQPVGFAKISFDEHNDHCLANEAKILDLLRAENHTEFRVPKVIDYRAPSAGSSAVLLFEPIPVDAKPIGSGWSSYPAVCADAIAGVPRILGTDSCSSLSWWDEYLKLQDTHNPHFAHGLAEAQVDLALLSRSHGDFMIANMVRDSNNTLWIFDWEESRSDGPALTDEMSFFLGMNRPHSESDHTALIAKFRKRFLPVDDAQHRADVMMALAFRSTVHAQDADLIISRWEQL